MKGERMMAGSLMRKGRERAKSTKARQTEIYFQQRATVALFRHWGDEWGLNFHLKGRNGPSAAEAAPGITATVRQKRVQNVK